MTVARRRLCALVLAAVVAGACTGDGRPPKSLTGVAGPASTASSTSTTTTAPPATATTAATTAVPSAPSPSTATTTAPAPAPPAPGTLAWSKCGSLQCATLRVPVDYANPGGPTLDLALARRPAGSPSTRIGSLVFNPGGPGDSGIDALPHELEALNPVLRARFDVVSWDPRGIGRSAPIRCPSTGGGSSSGDSAPVDPMPTTDADRQRLADGYRAYANQCLRNHGEHYLRHVGTDSTAEDLERIRVALGDERLTFIGHSSGTLLGAIYAERHPERVRALVLDGPIDPSLDLLGMTRAQAVAFERTLDGFFAWCAADPGCAWRPGPDLRNGFLALLDRIRREPLSAPEGEKVGVSELMTGVMGRLYARSRWPSLGQALGSAEQGDGSPLATLSSRYINGGASNFADARSAITCADHPAPNDPAAYPALADAAAKEAPVFGPLFTWAALSCGVWPVAASLQPHPVRAPGAPPILVVGTTGDPATPKDWAESLAGQLAQGVLVLRQGSEHVAYYYSSCVRGIVDAYLVDGRLPASGTTCR